MIKYILTTILAFLVGVAIAVFAYSKIVPFPHDVVARGAAFEAEDEDWLLQHASEVFPTRTVSRAEEGQPFEIIAGTLEGFTFEHEGKTRALNDLYEDTQASGLIILHHGKIVHESYGRGAGPGTRFTTYSLVKSFTSTLVGFAVKDGLIEGVEDQLTKYLPELVGTAYDGVTIRQAMEMSSGVRFDEAGAGGQDTVQFITDSAILGKTSAFEIAAAYPRAAEPGTVFNYNTAETQVLLELIRRVTGKTAAAYLEEKIWRPLGMAHDAGWILDAPGPDGVEIGGAFFNSTLRDWARFGQFIEQDGKWNGEQLLPETWVEEATISRLPHLMHGVPHPNARRGYAWQWWTFEDGTFTASGSQGQSLYIDQANNIVVASAAAWPEGWVSEYDEEKFVMYKALGDWFAAREVSPSLASEVIAAQEN